MSVYTISDLHLSFSTEKSMEIFDGWKDYTEKLKKNWRDLVSPDDVVIIVGDISWAMNLEDSEEDLRFINSLPGKKILIKGNHDFWWSTSKKVNDFLKKNNFTTISILHNSAYETQGICVCGTRGWMCRIEKDEDRKIMAREVGRLRRSLEEAQEKKSEPVVFLHYPPVYAGEESEEIINLLIEKKVKRCYYGHIHGCGATKKTIEGDYKGIKFKLVSCDYINFCPVSVV